MAKSRKRSVSDTSTPGAVAAAPSAALPPQQTMAGDPRMDTADDRRTDARDDRRTDDEYRRRIEQRAYELYLSRGGAHGSDREDWLAAERELVGSASDDRSKA